MRLASRLPINMISLSGSRTDSLTQARGRLFFVITIFMALFVVIALRAFNLAVIDGRSAPREELIAANDDTVKEHILRRGKIFDRNGVMMATSIKTASLFADPRLIDNAEKAARGLIKIFPSLNYGEVLQKLQSDRHFIWVKRNITPDEQYQVLELGQPGLEFDREDRRIYPQENLAAHILGFTDIDNHGLGGIERSFENHLAQGHDLTLTIDTRLQHVLRRELKKAIDDFHAKGGAGVIMDVKTGEVLAGVSLPDFKPHALTEASNAQLFNRLTLGVYELGSVFKIFSTAALLDTHKLPMGTTFDTREPIQVGRFTISDYHPEDREMTIPEIFMHSSNIGSALMAQQVGTEGIQKFYHDLGLLTPMEFELDEVGSPLVPTPWREITTLTASYGHGLATTPMQAAAAVSSIVNGGLLVKPRLVIDNQSDDLKQHLRIVSPETSRQMNELMRLVVTTGTGSKAETPGYVVGGKTGTAEKPGTRGYDHDKLISSFMGAFPMNDPKYVIYVMVDEPHGNKKSYGYATAGWVAAPAVSKIVQAMANILGISPVDEAHMRPVERDLIRYLTPEEQKKMKKGVQNASF